MVAADEELLGAAWALLMGAMEPLSNRSEAETLAELPLGPLEAELGPRGEAGGDNCCWPAAV